MKLLYPAIFYPFAEGSGYTVEVPDLPGCITEGYDPRHSYFAISSSSSMDLTTTRLAWY